MLYLASRGYRCIAHDMCTMLNDDVNEDLLGFIKG
jgi:hypothetical protein